ncbi:MAG TPA: ABC transporter ATP-binding protein [Labilithrix sp.]|jgi:ABC-2 type transport system ATP-binding protein|nr:ABC transporter ATP-binding protein [Labilithrix sp.]
MSIAVSLRQVHLRRGRFELAIDTLDLEEGTIVGLVGNNGAGKSTLVDAIAGFHVPDRGAVTVLGRDPFADLVAVRQQLGWMTDDMAVYPMKLGAHLKLLAPFYPTWDHALAQHLLDRFELDPGRRLTELSKGEGTRARLVMALAYRPRLVLLDEPATGLDVPSRRKLMHELVSVVRDAGRTVIIASHQLEDVERISDRVLLLHHGRIRADGAPAEVAAQWGTLEERLAVEGAA